MPLYKCKVVNSDGENKTLFRNATDEITLKGEFRRENMYVRSIKSVNSMNEKSFFLVGNKVKFNEVITFFRQFAVMLKAGVTISDCLTNLQKQKCTLAFKKVLEAINVDVKSGVLLSEAFARHPKVFPKFFISMVSIGEVSGTLDEVMTDMADYYENDRKIRKKASSAMIYPTLLICMIFFVIAFLCLFVLPQFEATIIQLGGEVPKITVIILKISKFVQKYILLLILGIVVILLSIIMFFKTKMGKYVRDILKLHLPIISKIERNLITARFSRAFIILLKSGMNMIEVLENLKKMLGNEVFERKFDYSIDEIKRGKRIASSIEATHIFPLMLTEMIDVGENSGNIEEVLTSTGSYFDTQVENSIAKAIAIIEPVAIILLGAVVSIVIISVLIPMMSMMNAI